MKYKSMLVTYRIVERRNLLTINSNFFVNDEKLCYVAELTCASHRTTGAGQLFTCTVYEMNDAGTAVKI